MGIARHRGLAMQVMQRNAPGLTASSVRNGLDICQRAVCLCMRQPPQKMMHMCTVGTGTSPHLRWVPSMSVVSSRSAATLATCQLFTARRWTFASCRRQLRLSPVKEFVDLVGLLLTLTGLQHENRHSARSV